MYGGIGPGQRLHWPVSGIPGSWTWTHSPRELSASCAPGIPVETMDAKVKPSRCQPLLAWHWDLTRELARARPRAYPSPQSDWDSDLQERLHYCLTHGAVCACPFIHPLRIRAASLSTQEVRSKPCGCAGWREAGDASKRAANSVLIGSWGRVAVSLRKPKPVGQGQASARGCRLWAPRLGQRVRGNPGACAE